MLILTRGIGEGIVIGTGPSKIRVSLNGIKGQRVAAIGIEAPPETPIYRDELYHEGIDSNAAGLKNPNAWQQRVRDEKKALDEKLTALRAFLSTDTKVVGDDRVFLMSQESYMTSYSETLGVRISRFAAVATRVDSAPDAPNEARSHQRDQ